MVLWVYSTLTTDIAENRIAKRRKSVPYKRNALFVYSSTKRKTAKINTMINCCCPHSHSSFSTIEIHPIKSSHFSENKAPCHQQGAFLYAMICSDPPIAFLRFVYKLIKL